MDLLNTKQYTAKGNSAHTGSNVQKYGVIIKLPKSTVSSYETNIFLPAVIRKKKICWLQIFVNTLDLNPECFEKRKEKSLSLIWESSLVRKIFFEWFWLVRRMRMLLKAIILHLKWYYWPLLKENFPNSQFFMC